MDRHVGGADQPGEALATVAERDLGTDHLLDEVVVEQLRAPGEQDLAEHGQVLGRRDDVSRRAGTPWHATLFGDEGSHFWIEPMTRRDPSSRFEAGGCRGLQTQWLEDPLRECVVEGPAIENFDEATENGVAAVAVGPEGSGFVKEADFWEDLRNVPFQAVVILPGVGEVVCTIDAARMGEQLADRHSLGCAGDDEMEVRQVGR